MQGCLTRLAGERREGQGSLLGDSPIGRLLSARSRR